MSRPYWIEPDHFARLTEGLPGRIWVWPIGRLVICWHSKRKGMSNA